MHANGSGVCDSDEGNCWVKFSIFGSWEPNYKVIDTDYDSYTIVYSCDSFSSTMWILTREPTISDTMFESLQQKAKMLLPNYDFNTMYSQDVQGEMCSYVNDYKQYDAVCVMNPDNGSSVSGIVKMTQTGGQKAKIVADVEGLSPGQHGFHIHENGILDGSCKSAGPHYNPYGKNHGGPESEERHVGDLGMLVAGEDGLAHYEREDHQIMLHGE